MVKGQSFGEKALKKQAGKRTASIIALENCEFMIILKEDLNYILERFNSKNLKKKEFLLRNLPFFNRVSGINILDTFHYHFYEKVLKKGDILFKEGKKGDFIYFILDGWLSLSKDIEFNIKTENETNMKKIISTKICETG